MRIMLITPLYPGYINQSPIEATYVVHHMAKEWTKEHDVRVIRLWPYFPKGLNFSSQMKKLKQYSYEEKFTLDNVNILRIPIRKIPKLSYMKKDLEKIIQLITTDVKFEERPDVIICDTLDPSIYIGEALSKKFQSKLIASLHNTDIKYLSKKGNYNKFSNIDNSIYKVIFRSSNVENNFLEIYSGFKKNNEYFNIMFGIDENDYISKYELEKKIKNSRKEILVAANLKKLKNVDILIKAFAGIEQKSEYILRIIGNGVERKALENLSESLECDERIIFEGEKKREEVLKMMEGAEIFAMVSSPETFGLVYIEAMAKGCITIGSKGEGIDGVIEHRKNGFLCSPNNIEDLKEILNQATSMEIEDKHKLLSNALSTALEFDNKILANDYIENIK